MARTFTRSSANYLSLGVGAMAPRLSGHGVISIHAFVWVTGLVGSAGSNDNRVFSFLINGNDSGLVLCFESTGEVRILARSQTADTLQVANGTTTATTGAWRSVGGVVNFGTDEILIYYEGALETTSTGKAFGAATFTPGTPTGADTIGGLLAPPGNTNDQFDGPIAEITLWNGDIGAAGYAALGNRVSGRFVRPDLCISHRPLWGMESPEPDYVTGINGSITGSLPYVDHPPLLYPAGAPWGLRGAGGLADVTLTPGSIDATAHVGTPELAAVPEELVVVLQPGRVRCVLPLKTSVRVILEG